MVCCVVTIQLSASQTAAVWVQSSSQEYSSLQHVCHHQLQELAAAQKLQQSFQAMRTVLEHFLHVVQHQVPCCTM